MRSPICNCSRILNPVWLLLVLGCGAASDGKLPVAGEIRWNGQPLDSGYIELVPLDEKGGVEGAEIRAGMFQLRAIPGQKQILVMAHRQIGMTEPDERVPTPEPILFQYLPEKFNSNSELTVTVSSSAPQIRLDLQGTELQQPKSVATTRR